MIFIYHTILTLYIGIIIIIMALLNTNPVFIFRHGPRQDVICEVDPPIFPIDQIIDLEQVADPELEINRQHRLADLNRITDFLIKIGLPIVVAHSPFRRCRETSAFVTNMLINKGCRHLAIQIDNDLREVGDTAVKACLDAGLDTYIDIVGTIEKETVAQANDRFNRTFNKYIQMAKTNNCSILLFSHGDAVASVIQQNELITNDDNMIYSVPPLAWFSKYASGPQDNQYTWCDDIGQIGLNRNLTVDEFFRG